MSQVTRLSVFLKREMSAASMPKTAGTCRGKVPYYTASHTTLHLNQNREDLRQRKFNEPLAVAAGRGRASLSTSTDARRSKRGMDIVDL